MMRSIRNLRDKVSGGDSQYSLSRSPSMAGGNLLAINNATNMLSSRNLGPTTPNQRAAKRDLFLSNEFHNAILNRTGGASPRGGGAGG